MPERPKLLAYTSPMILFALLALNSGLKTFGGAFWLRSPEYWIYPAQTIFCGALLIWFWRDYSLAKPERLDFGLFVGVFAFALWISPQALFGVAPRNVGFDPTVFGHQPALSGATLGLRFLRLVVVVPLMEEIFWRGFLLRYLIDENFERVPIGTFSWLSFTAVTVAFALSHSRPDWPAALLTGMLYNAVAYRTKSLSTCVCTHAVTNLLLGLWIVYTRQWGFW